MNSKILQVLAIVLSASLFASSAVAKGTSGIYRRATPPGTAASTVTSTPPPPTATPDPEATTTKKTNTVETTTTEETTTETAATETITEETSTDEVSMESSTSSIETDSTTTESTETFQTDAYDYYNYDDMKDYDTFLDYGLEDGEKIKAPNGDYFIAATNHYNTGSSYGYAQAPIQEGSAYGNPVLPLTGVYAAAPEPLAYGDGAGASAYGNPNPPLVADYSSLDSKDNMEYDNDKHEDHQDSTGKDEHDYKGQKEDHVDHDYSAGTSTHQDEDLYVSGSLMSGFSAGIFILLAVF